MNTLASTFNNTYGLDYEQRTYPSSLNELLPKCVQQAINNYYVRSPASNDVIGISQGLDDLPSLARLKEQLYELFAAAKDGALTSENSLVNHVKSKREVQSEILAFKVLLGCWDGDDAEPIAIGAIDSAHLFLESYQGNLIFDAFPDPDGSVGLQADFAEGRVILSFDDSGEVAYLIRINKAIHRGHSATHETINSLFSSLL
ncbi:MAG: hypothetical protein Q7S69_09030 [Nitrosomonadaceae bacterium]|nr:hypothetical protein [Nitrosomonadaceae bacterium]